MIFKVSSLRKTFLYLIQGPKFYKDSSGQSTSVTQATIPDELKPYISTYMGAAEKQLYKKKAEGEVTGFQPYKAYGATFDAQGNQTAYDPSKGIAGFDPMQVQGYNAAQGLSTGNTFGTATGMATGAGQGMMGSAGTALGYGAQGQAIGQQGAANAANQAGSQIGQAGGYGAQGAGIGMSAAGQAGQGYNAQGNFANQITNPGTTAAYMSPYMQNVVNQQISAANRQYDITGSQEMANASRANAFGGSREALMAAENERARNTAIGDIQAKGLQSAFTEAQMQQQFGANLGIQGLNAGTNAMQAGIQGAQTGIQGVGAQTAASNMQLAGNAQALQGNAQALEGVRTAQAGYMGANQAAGTLGNLGSQDLAAQQSIIKTQVDLGGQARARDQAIKDQAMLDYANDQNKPMQDIGTMSNLVRGISTGSNTQTQYATQPSAMSQIGGLAATGIGAYGALKANGGVIEDRGYANGGIVGYKDRGYVEESMRSKLEDLDNPRLQEIIKENESPEMTKLAKEVLATNYAKGGIVAFAGKKTENVVEDDAAVGRKTQAQLQAEQKLAASKGASQGLGAIETPALITPKEAATLGPMSSEMPLKQMAQNQAEGIAMPGVDKIGLPLNPSANDPMAQLQASRDTAAADAAIPLDTRIQQQKDLEEKFVGKDTETAAYRKSIMDERANAPDEARRQMYIRLMEFGANWASTPGAPLVAGMKALTSTLSALMSDRKDDKKMLKDFATAEWQLNHAVRLEELGRMDKAAAYKEKASELFLKYDDKVVDAALKKQQLDQLKEISEAELANRITTTGMTNAASIKAHEISAAAGGKGDKSATENARILARQNALKQAVTEAEDEGKFTDADGKEISKSAWTKNRTVELEDYFLNVQPAAKQPKTEPTVVPLPSVGTIKDGYKYLGGDINKESSWSKI